MPVNDHTVLFFFLLFFFSGIIEVAVQNLVL